MGVARVTGVAVRRVSRRQLPFEQGAGIIVAAWSALDSRHCVESAGDGFQEAMPLWCRGVRNRLSRVRSDGLV